MTELEKKAEEYVNKAIEGYEQDFDKCEIFSMRTCYKDGYEQGQKEECCLCHYYSDFDKLKKENEELKEDKDLLMTRNLDLVNQIEKMKCCGNCGNERCTSKYRGNSCYHRQNDGYACADNEDWTPRKDK